MLAARGAHSHSYDRVLYAQVPANFFYQILTSKSIQRIYESLSLLLQYP